MRYVELIIDRENKKEYIKGGLCLREQKRMKRSIDEWLVLINRLEAYAASPGKTKAEQELYKNKANEIRAKIEYQNKQTKFVDTLQDFNNLQIPSAHYTYNKFGKFEPFSFKKSRKVDINA